MTNLSINHWQLTWLFYKKWVFKTTLAPGLTLSRAQVIRVLVNEKYAYEAIDELDQFSIDDHKRKDN